MELSLSSRPTTTAIRIQTPLIVALPLLVSFWVAVAAVMALASSQPISYPLDAYADLMPSNIWRAIRGFDCHERNALPERLTCSFAPTAGAFTQVDLHVSEDEVSFVAFTVSQRSLLVGDLVLWWGRPAIQSVGNTAMLTWRTYAASAHLSRPYDGQFDYFLPLSVITIEREIIP